MNRFTVNEKTYTAKEFDFNLVCDLEDMGVSMDKAKEKPLSMVRAYFALCTGRGKEYAGKEMQEHLVNGGSFDDISEVMGKEMENSDFFRSLNKGEETENAESKSKKSKKAEE
jgi:hypothetical protein